MHLLIDATEWIALAAKVRTFSLHAAHPTTLIRAIGSEGAVQTRRRIFEEKTDPNGNGWLPWSPRYAATRRPGNSLLIDTHDLVDSIDSYADGNTAVVFSDVVYAGTHQDGHGNVPARPFLGVSDANAEDFGRLVADGALDLFWRDCA